MKESSRQLFDVLEFAQKASFFVVFATLLDYAGGGPLLLSPKYMISFFIVGYVLRGTLLSWVFSDVISTHDADYGLAAISYGFSFLFPLLAGFIVYYYGMTHTPTNLAIVLSSVSLLVLWGVQYDIE